VGFVRRHQRLAFATGGVFVVFVAFVLWWFQPQKLFIDETVNEPAPAAPLVVATGMFHSGEHHTEGSAHLLRLAGGRHALRLADLRTSNGPVLKVWLTAADADASNGEINDAAHLDLGGLKGNIGSQNYTIPASAELGSYRAVVIWCARFHVAFGTAPLAVVEEGA